MVRVPWSTVLIGVLSLVENTSYLIGCNWAWWSSMLHCTSSVGGWSLVSSMWVILAHWSSEKWTKYKLWTLSLLATYNHYCNVFQEPLIPTPLPDYPWQRIGTDLFQYRTALKQLAVEGSISYGSWLPCHRAEYSITALPGCRIDLCEFIYTS